MRGIILLAMSTAALGVPTFAQQAPNPATTVADEKAPFVKAEAQSVLQTLAKELEDNFVFPDKGQAYAAMLKANLAAGKYDSFADAEAFADAVTADLQAVHEDRHLKLRAPKKSVEKGQQVRRGPPADFNAIAKSGWLAKGVAYVRFDGFPGNEPTIAALRQFLEAHEGATTLIIDAREHRGGGLAEMDLLFAQLYTKPTILVGMDTRQAVDERDGNPIGDAALRKIAGPAGVVRREHFVTPAAQPTGLSHAKVYLLTSGRTASAGEHLSLALKRTNRATLIGEATRGAGHYGGVADLGHGYAAFIPVGRTFDPDTNEGWEGKGVSPHVQVPADKALDEALRLAGVSASSASVLATLP